MVTVIKHNRKFPYSRGILARSIIGTGVSLNEAYEIVTEVREGLQREDKDSITSVELKEMISEELLSRGYDKENRYYLMRSYIKNSRTPVFILIGGGSGVGKSTISSELGHRLGITRVISTDTIREIMRYVLSEKLVPTLHRSTFDAGESLKIPEVDDKVMYAFEQQASLVNGGVRAVMRRARKEGLKVIINGVHLVPGFLEEKLNDDSIKVFEYILDIPDVERHKHQFYEREEGSLRDPERYIRNIDNIRNVHSFLLKSAEKHDVKVIRNHDMETTIRTILEDVSSKLGEEI